MSNPSESLFYVCVGGKCHCDFRITIDGCHEGDVQRIIYYVTLGITSVVVVCGKYEKGLEK